MSDKNDKKNATIGDYADYCIDSKYIDLVFDEPLEFISALCEQKRQTTFDLDLDDLGDSGDSERRRIVEELKASVERFRKTSILVHPQLLEDLKKDSGWTATWV
jgi:hypothetical protein